MISNLSSIHLFLRNPSELSCSWNCLYQLLFVCNTHKAVYLILANFARTELISRIFGSRISRVLIFAIIAKKIREKAYKISRFCLCLYPEQRALARKQWNIYIPKQDCKLTTALHRTLWTRQNITACCELCMVVYAVYAMYIIQFSA